MNMSLHPKVAAGTLAAALTGILISELSRRGISIGAGEAANITTIIAFVAGYFTPQGAA
jgi:hypothetical protein